MISNPILCDKSDAKKPSVYMGGCLSNHQYMTPDASRESSPVLARMCDDDQAIREAGIGGAPEAEGTASSVLRSPSDLHQGDTEGHSDPMQSDSGSGGSDGDLSSECGGDLTPSDNLPLGSMPDSSVSVQEETQICSDTASSSPVLAAMQAEDGSVPDIPVFAHPIDLYVLKPGFEECVKEVRAFVRGGLPALVMLQKVLPVIFDAYGVTGFLRCKVLTESGLKPIVGDQYVTFLIPKSMNSPEWCL